MTIAEYTHVLCAGADELFQYVFQIVWNALDDPGKEPKMSKRR